MSIHNVKSWKHLYDAAINGLKTHDVRIMDRDYRVGDTLVLQEYDWATKSYTGRETEFEITYITSQAHVPCAFSPVVLHPQHAILSIKKKNSDT